MIEEEREEDEKKLNIAIAAAERMNVLVRQSTPKELREFTLKSMYLTN